LAFQVFENQALRHLRVMPGKEVMDEELAAELVRSRCGGAATALLTQLDLEGTPLSFPKEVLGQLRSHLVAPLDGGESRAILRSKVMRKGKALSSFVSRIRAVAVAFPGTPAEAWSYFLLRVGHQLTSSLQKYGKRPH
jgi:hypothetical protein